MKKQIFLSIFITVSILSGCKKPASDSPVSNTTTEAQVLNDFAATLANPNYQDIQARAGLLNQAAQSLSTNPNSANLTAAQLAWRNVRVAWEQCEGYLFGPVEDFNYDPSTDTWPLDKSSLDSLVGSKSPLTLAVIDSLPFSLKGYHAIEYIIFGQGGTRTVSQLNARDFQYLLSLTQSLYNTTTALRNSWDPAQQNFSAQVINAGNGSTRFSSRKAVFLTIVGSMSDICNEVANEKMQDPLKARDSTLDESSFSHNSTADFKNNIIGVQNAYLATYGNAQGHSLSELVAAKDISLNNTIRSELAAAIASFDQINSSYEKAIFDQRVQIMNTQSLINTLKNSLDNELVTFVQTNIKD